MKKYTHFSAFSGIGAFEKGFDKIGQPYELYGYCEIDKYASKAYALIHNTDELMNYGGITKFDETKIEKDLDFFTYGFPCQDISLAGISNSQRYKMAGNSIVVNVAAKILKNLIEQLKGALD